MNTVDITAICGECSNTETTNDIFRISTSTGACKCCGGNRLAYRGDGEFNILLTKIIRAEEAREYYKKKLGG